MSCGNKYVMKIKANKLGSYLIAGQIAFIFGLACNTPSRSSIEAEKKDGLIKVSPTYRSASGNEVVATIRTNKLKRQVLLTVHNLSSEDVFMPFLPGINTEYAVLVILGLEKKNPVGGQFESYGASDFGPGLHPLHAGESFKYIFSLEEPGTYKLTLRYSVDKDLVERIKRAEALEIGSDSWRAENAELNDILSKDVIGTVSLEPFDLH